MNQAAHHHHINYIEFTASDVARAKAFYGGVFGWAFQDWGADYVSFSSESGGIDGGFRRAEAGGETGKGGPLVVLYSSNLSATEEAIVAAGGSIVVPTFEFPGGKRFHFADEVGNVLAVWSE